MHASMQKDRLTDRQKYRHHTNTHTQRSLHMYTCRHAQPIENLFGHSFPLPSCLRSTVHVVIPPFVHDVFHCVSSFVRLFIDPFVRSFVHSLFNRSFVPSFVRSSVQPVIHSLLQSFTCTRSFVRLLCRLVGQTVGG